MWNWIYMVFTMSVAIVSLYLDFASTKTNIVLPGFWEKNKRYVSDVDGHVKMGKLAADKFLLFGITLGLCLVVYFINWDFTPFPKSVAFTVFLAVALRHLIVWRSNARLTRLYYEKLERLEQGVAQAKRDAEAERIREILAARDGA